MPLREERISLVHKLSRGRLTLLLPLPWPCLPEHQNALQRNGWCKESAALPIQTSQMDPLVRFAPRDVVDLSIFLGAAPVHEESQCPGRDCVGAQSKVSKGRRCVQDDDCLRFAAPSIMNGAALTEG